MRPEQIEQEFEDLRGAVKAGAINEEEFEANLREFLFRDGSGVYWTIGAQTQKWYRHEEGDWIEGSPPPDLERAPAEGAAPEVGVPKAPSRQRRGVDPRVLLGLGSLACLVVVILVAAVAYQLGRISGVTAPMLESPSAAVELMQSPTPEEEVPPTTTAATPLPTEEAAPSPEATSTRRIPTPTPQPPPPATATSLPAPAMKYGPPVLAAPQDEAQFGPGYDALLEWRLVETLDEGEYYHVEVCWNECQDADEFHGGYLRESSYLFPGWIYRGRAIDEKYYWHVTVRAQQGDQPAGPGDPAISEPSQTRVFLLTE